jgi:hypothetical protein
MKVEMATQDKLVDQAVLHQRIQLVELKRVLVQEQQGKVTAVVLVEEQTRVKEQVVVVVQVQQVVQDL